MNRQTNLVACTVTCHKCRSLADNRYATIFVQTNRFVMFVAVPVNRQQPWLSNTLCRRLHWASGEQAESVKRTCSSTWQAVWGPQELRSWTAAELEQLVACARQASRTHVQHTQASRQLRTCHERVEPQRDHHGGHTTGESNKLIKPFKPLRDLSYSY